LPFGAVFVVFALVLVVVFAVVVFVLSLNCQFAIVNLQLRQH